MKTKLKIGWLYPKLMNIYADRGNIIVLERRCAWRDIETETIMLNVGFLDKKLLDCDILVMGGAQDRQQEAVSKDLFQKLKTLKEKIDKGTPGLYICGAYQFFGNYYKEANGNIIKGLGIFDIYTENPGENYKRLVGNIAFESQEPKQIMIGFENHGGRTYLGKNMKPFGEIISGYGNNGDDKTEGVHFNNSFGTYLHGPILPKNPVFADYLIKKALEIKYKKSITLKRLDDTLEEKARITIAKRLSVNL